MTAWQSLARHDLGLLNRVDSILARAAAEYAITISRLRHSRTLLVASDYAGQHAGSTHEVYSYLLTTPGAWASWDAARTVLRSRSRLGSRRFAYKKLADRLRQQALPHFLHAAGAFEALSVSLIVDKRLGSLFSNHGRLDLASPDFEPYRLWPQGSLERLLRVTHFLALLIAGVSSPSQDLVWFTDQDEIAANPERLTALTRAFALVSSHLLSHDLRNLRCGTTASDTGIRDIEDFASIPDLVAGALSELAATLRRSGITLSELIISVPSAVPGRCRTILEWLSDASLQLARVVILLEQPLDRGGVTLKRLRLHGMLGAV